MTCECARKTWTHTTFPSLSRTGLLTEQHIRHSSWTGREIYATILAEAWDIIKALSKCYIICLMDTPVCFWALLRKPTA